MIKKIGILTMALAVIGWTGVRTVLGAPQAASQAWTGMISDSTCGGDHGSEVDPKECTQKCIKNGDKYVLATENGLKVIPIANQAFAGLAPHAGEIVRVTGELKDGAIVIAKIEETRP